MNLRCIFGHDLDYLPSPPGVMRGHGGPRRCRRCNYSHPGFAYPWGPEEGRLRAQLEEAARRNLDIINRRVAVEQILLDVANGKREPPTREECRVLAVKLGVPPEFIEKAR